jgi:hypothetical protein
MTARELPLRTKRARWTMLACAAVCGGVAVPIDARAQTPPPATLATPNEQPPPPIAARPKGEVIGALGATAGSSTWPGDPVAMSTLKVGYRFFDWIAPYYLGRLGYGVVNHRSLLTLSFGVQMWGRLGPTRPYVRASILHQHEESLAAMRADTGGALFGVGDGIRHRYGGELGLGLDFPIHKNRAVEFVASLEATSDYMPDVRGPGWYVLGSAALGINYTLY